jgi:hypothetical protein
LILSIDDVLDMKNEVIRRVVSNPDKTAPLLTHPLVKIHNQLVDHAIKVALSEKMSVLLAVRAGMAPGPYALEFYIEKQDLKLDRGEGGDIDFDNMAEESIRLNLLKKNKYVALLSITPADIEEFESAGIS